MKIADKLKALRDYKPPGEPKTTWDRVIASTPVVMTVVATILAGLSSSEMSTAQYHRAMAAQFQSKAGDQWSFYQAKRMRESGNQTSLDLLEALTGPKRLDPQTFASQIQDVQHRLDQLNTTVTSLVQSNTIPNAGELKDLLEQSSKQTAMLASQWKEALADPQVELAAKYLTSDDLPTIQEHHLDLPAVDEVLAAIDAGKNETETVVLVRKVKREDLDKAEVAATANATAFDATTKPITASIDRLSLLVSTETGMLRRLQRDVVDQLSASSAEGADVVQFLRGIAALRQVGDDAMGSFSAARLRFDARRYHKESAYNFDVARLYEVEVRRSSGLSDRNRDRSKNFFYGMLVAQGAVTIATFSLALREQSVLWAIASAAGALAIGLGIYVYLFT